VFAGDKLNVLQTDESWRVSKQTHGNEWLKPESSEQGWMPATVVCAANQAPWINIKNWPRPLPDPASHNLRILSVPPVSITPINPASIGMVSAFSSSVELHVDRNRTEAWYDSSSMPLKTRLAFARRELPGVVVDFGREMAGRLRVRSGCDEPIAVLVAFGESPGEMWNAPHTGILDLFVPPNGTAITLSSGFRYAAVYAIPLLKGGTGTAELKLSEIVCDLVHQPLRYQGSCASSDKLITQLWTMGAYTTHLCLQRELWDAPKRDRNAYGGDLHPVTPILHEVFGNPEPVYRTLDVLSAAIWSPGKPILRHVNGICGYSASWIHTLFDSFLHTDDQSEVAKRLPFLVALLRYMEDDLDEHDLFANKTNQWCFVDWAVDLTGVPGEVASHASSSVHECRIATHFFFMSAFNRAAELLRSANQSDTAMLAGHYKQLYSRMRDSARQQWWNAATGSFGNRIQTNAAAIYAGAVVGAEASHIADTVLLPQLQQMKSKLSDISAAEKVVTPYFYFYLLEALAMAGRVNEAASVMRNYYGEMLRRGATTYWEHFDPQMEAGPLIPGYGPDWAVDSRQGEPAYHDSLCHCWSSAPTSWITHYMVGISPAAHGYAQVSVIPNLCGLTWIEGSVSTLRGILRARHTVLQHGWQTVLSLPAATEARVIVPGLERKNARVRANGVSELVQVDGLGRGFVRIARAGTTVLEVS
jgi:alpha-L-rhamnosidase